jgi:hypothetical protein
MTEIFDVASILGMSHGAFLRGAATAFDLTGNTSRYFHFATSADEADINALSNDVAVVLEDAIDVLAVA